MKRTFVIVLALLLSLPAISFAGTVTSRWDLTIGGTVKFDMGYADQNANSNPRASARKPLSGQHSDDYSVGNFFMNGSETGLNFFIKGPDVWGAKTSAFIAADFTGSWAAANNHTFALLIGQMKVDWPTTSVEFGVMPAISGLLPTFAGNILTYGALNQFDKGFPSVPQVIVTKKFGKDWTAKFGVMQFGAGGGVPPAAAATSQNNAFTRAGTPGVEAAIRYSSDKCGRVGPWQLTAQVSGAYARERHLSAVSPANADSFGDGWLADFTVLVPIIPQSNAGNKRGAFYVDGLVFTEQNAGILAPPGPWNAGSYARADGDWTAPVLSGWEAHAAYYFTDKLWANAFYGYARAFKSHRQRNLNPNSFVNNQQLFVNLLYDVNPALRVGVEYVNMHTRYAKDTPTLSNKGTLNVYRVGAWYFF